MTMGNNDAAEIQRALAELEARPVSRMNLGTLARLLDDLATLRKANAREFQKRMKSSNRTDGE